MKTKDKNFDFNDVRFGDQEDIEYNEALQDYLKIMYNQIKYENKMVGNFSIYGIQQGLRKLKRVWLLLKSLFLRLMI